MSLEKETPIQRVHHPPIFMFRFVTDVENEVSFNLQAHEEGDLEQSEAWLIDSE